MKRRNFLAVAAVLTIVVGVAQAKPNFSGEWKLNADKSDFGPMPPPSSAVLKITHEEPSMKVASTQEGPQGEMSWEASYTTDGKESTNKMGPMDAKSTANWEGDDLVINTKLEANGMEITLKGKWTLSGDGKTLTNAMHINSPQGEFDMKQVYEKQSKKE